MKREPDRLAGLHFGEERIEADGCEFVGCTFTGTTLIFRGEAVFTIAETRPEQMDIAVAFEGKALVVLNQLCMMQMFGMHDLVAQFVAKITNPTGAGLH